LREPVNVNVATYIITYNVKDAAANGDPLQELLSLLQLGGGGGGTADGNLQ
jgi:CRISPR/Cas system type I-B associated protein Csh2 (Cas7 group RAMP superfamily)